MSQNADDFDFDDDNSSPSAEKTSQENALARMQKERDKYKALADKKFDEGREAALKEVEVKTKLTEVATKLGNSALVNTYTNQRDFKIEDATEENFLAFAEPLGFKPSDKEETPVETPSAVTPTDPFHRGIGGATPANGQMVTAKEAMAKVASGEWNEAQVTAAVKGGQVQLGTT